MKSAVPGITDNAEAWQGARTIAAWNPLPFPARRVRRARLQLGKER
jgi:hypothetical protein